MGGNMAIIWEDYLSIGVAEIDGQHKELFSRFNALLEACNQGKGREEVRRLLLFLNDYIKTHFAAEEALQIRHKYPGYAAHKEQHDSFIHKIDEFARQFNSEGATISLVIQVNQTLVNWLIEHIRKVDQALGEYLQKS
jgi:hemerythrin